MADFIRQLRVDGDRYNRRSIWSLLHLDGPLFLMLVLLAVSGLIIIYSASGQDMHMVKKQGASFMVAFVIMLIVAQFDPRWLQMMAPWAYLLGLVALIGVLLFGVGAKGAQRWLQLPGLPRFQPSELMKIVVPMMVAWYLSKQVLPPKWYVIVITLVMIFVPVVMILKQPDLGTSLLISASGLLVLFFAGLRWRLIFAFGGVIAAAAPLMWFFVMHPYQKQRVLTFLDPESDPLGSGWNIIQSKTAIGSGGMDGKGFMQGTQSQLEFLPESHTDFIIAVMGEELGMVGILMLLSVYVAIVARGLFIASQARDIFGRLLASALTITFFIYVFVNIGMVTGILPVVGVPLPLISYGGTSVVSLIAAFGVIMSIHTHRNY